MMSINERLKTIIEEQYNGNKRAFSMAIGVTPTVIENVVGSRQGKPSFDVLEKICANANISPDWLLMNRGKMLYTSPQDSSVTTKSQAASANLSPDMLTELLNRITEQAAEIGRLKEQIRQMNLEKGKPASDAYTSGDAIVG